jgi:large repetitive protein
MKKLVVLMLMCVPSLFAQELKYGTYFGGRETDIGHGVVLDPANNMYVTGFTTSSNFPVLNAFQRNLGGVSNAFVAEFNSNGTLAWSTFFGGSGTDKASAIAIDSAKNLYVTGVTNSTNFPVTAGVAQRQLTGFGTNAFVAKFTSAGKLVWSTFLGEGGTEGNSIALDTAGNVFVGGDTAGVGNMKDGYVAELNSTGTSIKWSGTIGGTRTDSIRSIALLGDEVYAVGYTNSIDFPTTVGAVQPNCGTACSDNFNGFVAKLGIGGVSYATYLGGTKTTVPGTTLNLGIGIAVDATGDAYITGTTNTVDFPVTSGAFQTKYAGTTDLPGGVAGCIDFLAGKVPCGDAYAVKLNPTGTAIDWATYLGGSTADIGYVIKLDGKGNVWLAGYTQSYACPTCKPPLSPLPTTSNAFQKLKGGGLDGFLSELSPNGASLLYSTYYGGANDEEVFGFTMDSLGSAYLVGRTISTNTPITTNAFQKKLAGTVNVFLAKIQP